VANSVGFAPGVRKWRWTCLGGRGRCNGHRRELDSNWFGFMESRHRIEVVCTKSINSHSTSKLSEPSDRPRYIILNRSAWPTGYEYTTTSPLDKIPDPLVGGRCPTVFVQKKRSRTLVVAWSTTWERGSWARGHRTATENDLANWQCDDMTTELKMTRTCSLALVIRCQVELELELIGKFVANMASYAICSEFDFGDSWQHDHWN
jgi:hypothetical protein